MDLGDAADAEGADGEFAHLAGADDDEPFFREVLEDLLREARGHRRYRDVLLAERGRGVDALRDGEGLLEQPVEDAARGARGLGGEVGVLHLPDDLRLAEDHGVQARRHAEEVADRVAPLVVIEGGGEGVGGDAVALRQHLGDRRRLGRGSVVHRIEFDAVAGREDDHLLRGEGLLQLGEGGLERGLGHGQLFAKLDGRALVVQSGDGDFHQERHHKVTKDTKTGETPERIPGGVLLSVFVVRFFIGLMEAVEVAPEDAGPERRHDEQEAGGRGERGAPALEGRAAAEDEDHDIGREGERRQVDFRVVAPPRDDAVDVTGLQVAD